MEKLCRDQAKFAAFAIVQLMRTRVDIFQKRFLLAPNAFDKLTVFLEAICRVWRSYAAFQSSMRRLEILCRDQAKFAAFAIVQLMRPRVDIFQKCFLLAPNAFDKLTVCLEAICCVGEIMPRFGAVCGVWRNYAAFQRSLWRLEKLCRDPAKFAAFDIVKIHGNAEGEFFIMIPDRAKWLLTN
ncbi:hypothetical protein QT711_12030 [Sporosarcina saromensis]|uniref:Uncharacterized protein n=1 Tax=Sporosarcina saromensis TaxID=359365 RepID=A0ABU4GEA6_9BACL|nr:hypothetical protein [Sporosarcina saromensis]MDW0113917.1 hypothetical protein [Sporosarcina saromensis]